MSDVMLSKKLLAKTDSNSTDFDVPEKMKNLTEEDFINKARAGRKRHSVQLDKRITQQLLDGKVDRRSSNASSYAESTDSLCKFEILVLLIVLFTRCCCRNIILQQSWNDSGCRNLVPY